MGVCGDLEKKEECLEALSVLRECSTQYLKK